MRRKRTTESDLKKLFALSGNKCAFPDCTAAVFNSNRLLISEVCHIEAASPKGPRYNAHMTDIERASYENFIVLCHPHHVEIDNDTEKFTVDHLKKIKATHEENFTNRQFVLDDADLKKTSDMISNIWDEVDEIRDVRKIDEDLAFEFKTNSDFIELWNSVEDNIEWLNKLIESITSDYNDLHRMISSYLKQLGYDTSVFDDVPYYENPFCNRHWEALNLGCHNNYIKNKAMLIQMKLIYISSKRKKTKDDILEIDKIKKEMISMAYTYGYYD